MKHKIGDWVRIKTKEELQATSFKYGSWFYSNAQRVVAFNKEMQKEYCGKTYKIRNKTHNGYRLEGISWNWQDWMFSNTIKDLVDLIS